MSELALVISCEHARNRIPKSFQYLFTEAKEDVHSHWGWDPGALKLGHKLASSFAIFCYWYPYSRLLIEPNRSLDHPELFSRYTDPLPEHVKKFLIDNFYNPYRQKVERIISKHINKKKRVLHVSVHSFTPVWKGESREVQIGLLFDEERKEELNLCRCWMKHLKEEGSYITRFNEPYLGKDDGLVTSLRNKFDSENYLGIELEVSQGLLVTDFEPLQELLKTTLKSGIADYVTGKLPAD